MRRLLIALAVLLSISFAVSSAFAADAPGNGTLGQPASKEISKQADKSISVWASRVTRHDERALGMMSQDVIQALFSTIDPAYLSQSFAMRQKTTVNDVTVFVNGDNLIAQVSFTGFYSQSGYSTLLFTLVDDGSDYYRLDKVEFMTPSIPTDATVSVLDLQFNGGIASFSTSEIAASQFVQLNVVNNDAQTHALVLYAQGADQANIENQLASNAFGPSQEGTMAIAALPAGEYLVVDMAQHGLQLGTLTVK